ncbi:hypothetical protein EVA_16624 [gut metagenome]|uniref:Uncharacterized protein n=1 Tax=gut metagenome TaxID=749906 RepID=J9G0E3_9ZZZZ
MDTWMAMLVASFMDNFPFLEIYSFKVIPSINSMTM